MNISEFSLKRPVFAIVCSIVILVFGGVAYKFLSLREYPAIDPPNITVRTSYTGANSDIIESQITEPIEKAVNGIQGIRTITSSSNQGTSVITVEFNLDVNLDNAASDVRDKVSQALRQLPADIDAPPVISKADASGDVVIILSVQSKDKTILELSDFAENVLQEKLQTIPDVAGVNVFGQRRYAMRLDYNPDRMSSFGITVADIRNTLDRENIELPGGKLYGNNTELVVKTIGRLQDENDFRQLILKEDATGIVRLGDVAEVRLGSEIEEVGFRLNGVNAVACGIAPQPGANFIKISDEFYKRLEEIKKQKGFEDIEFKVVTDNTANVRRALKEVEETLAIALILVVLVVYFFFRNWSIAFRPLIDIPVSLIGAFFIMYVAGFSINVLTLLAIVLATGLVVDDGIVVTENIFRKLEEGMNIKDAAREGSREIFFAVISTSITLAVVFMPIIFIQGFVGSLFKEFGIVVAGAVLISAFVSLTLTPVLNVLLNRKNRKPSWFYVKTEPFFEGLENAYRRRLSGFMKKRWIAWPVIGLCFAAVAFIFSTLQTELAPLEDKSQFRFNVTAPEGTSFDYMDNFTRQLGDYFYDSIPEREFVFASTNNSFSSGSTNSAFGRVVISKPADRTRTQEEIVNSTNAKLGGFNDGRVFLIQEQTISVGFGSRGSLPVQYVLQNLDFEKIKDVLPKFLAEARKDPTFQAVDANLKFNKPELQVSIDRIKAKDLGLSVQDVAQTLQAALSGGRLGYFLMNGKQYQIVGQMSRANRDEPSDLNRYYIRNGRNELIQLSSVVKVEENSNPPQLYHYNRFKSATVSASLAPGKTTGDGVKAMRDIGNRLLDESFTTSLSGPSRDFEESSSNTSFAFLLALILIFLVLSAQFESFIDPLTIMVTVPLALAGALLSLWLTGNTINIFSQIGMIMLIGLVTKNGILIVEFANKKREQGIPKLQAIIDASTQRMRPILMTSLATALGALPIALSLGAASTSRISLGVVVVGGIIFSLMLTLFVIPAVYSFFSRDSKYISHQQPAAVPHKNEDHETN
jgi:hydrophobe/amphiphile efflux-1 (HAE1) family protein